MPDTRTTIVVTILLTRSNGHDITPTALKRAATLDDIAGLDLEHDDIIVHDITEATIARVNEWHIAATYEVVVEAGEDIDGDLLDLVDETLCFMPAEGWNFVQSTCLAK
jgi:hypothetical protein